MSNEADFNKTYWSILFFFTVDEMYLASLINKGRTAHVKGVTEPTALSSETILKMATINGAKTVLWDNEIGSLEIGKKVSSLGLLKFSFILDFNIIVM